jgi:hypothetical protein
MPEANNTETTSSAVKLRNPVRTPWSLFRDIVLLPCSRSRHTTSGSPPSQYSQAVHHLSRIRCIGGGCSAVACFREEVLWGCVNATLELWLEFCSVGTTHGLYARIAIVVERFKGPNYVVVPLSEQKDTKIIHIYGAHCGSVRPHQY